MVQQSYSLSEGADPGMVKTAKNLSPFSAEFFQQNTLGEPTELNVNALTEWCQLVRFKCCISNVHLPDEMAYGL